MTTVTENDAAERLREYLDHNLSLLGTLDDALAAERRATVERIRERISDIWPAGDDPTSVGLRYARIVVILDEEAAR